jgi:tetratricopeptide (TPR) repeat protein
MWTQEFDRPLKDIFRVQDEIVGKVVTTLGLIFKGEEMNFPHEAKLARPDNLEAFDDILHAGQYFYRFTREDAVKARGWAEKAIAADPNYAEAYATVSATYLNAVLFRWSDNPASDLERSYELTRKALALDDSNAVALAQLSTNDWLQRRFDKAVAEAERCVALPINQSAMRLCGSRWTFPTGWKRQAGLPRRQCGSIPRARTSTRISLARLTSTWGIIRRQYRYSKDTLRYFQTSHGRTSH